MSVPDDYPGSTRSIKHIVPIDGTVHDFVECYCHPNISEANNAAGLLGLDEHGIAAEESGELIFAHHKAAETSQWEIRLEEDAE